MTQSSAELELGLPASGADGSGGRLARLRERFGPKPGAAPSKPHAAALHEASTFTCICSGVVCGIQVFVFSAVFSEMIFGQDPVLQRAVPLGVGMNTMSCLVAALIFARLSGCRAVMAAPDINPVVFLAEAATAIMADLCPNGAGASCELAEKAVPTVLASTLIATFLVGLSFLLLGKLRLSVIVGFIPCSVTSGFLSCVGWKVLKAAIEIACPNGKPFKFKYYKYFFGSLAGSWQYVLPALPIGIPLYLLKRFHIGVPTLNFPLFILVPTAIFYLVVYGVGSNLEDARANGWLFERSKYSNCYDGWEELYGGLANEKVHWASLPLAIPSWVVMLLIVNLDNMLKLASTEATLGIDFEYNHETKVGGVATMATALLCGTPVYGQTKFSSLNYAMTHSTTQALPSLVCGVFCGALFLSGAPLIDYLPRFMLSGLLFFSAVGFLVENLFDTRHKFNRLNYLSVWAVFGINVGVGEVLPQYGLLMAIGTGLIWGLVAFAVHFARKSDLGTSETISGELHCSSAIRSAAQEAKLGVLGVWYTIFKTRGSYVFFGTAAILHREVARQLLAGRSRPRCERTKILIVDMSTVVAMDATAGSIFVKIQRLARQSGVAVVWAGLAPSVRDELSRSGCSAARAFETLDKAEKWVEDHLLEHVHGLALKWLVDTTCRDVYNRALLHDALTSTHSAIDGGIGPSQLLKWSRRTFVPKGGRVLTEGEPDDGLYLLYRGHVDVTEGIAQEDHTIYPGAVFNEHVLYSPPDTGALYTATAAEDSVLLRISSQQRARMQYASPSDAYLLLLTVFKQVEMRNPARRHHTWLEQAGVPKVEPPEPRTFTSRSEVGELASSKQRRSRSSKRLSKRNSSPSRAIASLGGLVAPERWRRSETDADADDTSTGLEGKSEGKSEGLSEGRQSSSGGVQRRRTTKIKEEAKRMTDRDTTMRNMVRLVAGPEGSAGPGGGAGPGYSAGPASAASGEDDSRLRAKSLGTSLLGTIFHISPSNGPLDEGSVGAELSTRSEPGSGRAPAAARSTTAHDHYHRELELVDHEFLTASDYTVPLTPEQREHYSLIFELNDHQGNGHLRIAELANFVDSLGHGVPLAELERMIHDIGIDEDADGAITLSEFLEFMRRMCIADLPASRLPRIHKLFRQEAEERQQRLREEAEAQEPAAASQICFSLDADDAAAVAAAAPATPQPLSPAPAPRKVSRDDAELPTLDRRNSRDREARRSREGLAADPTEAPRALVSRRQGHGLLASLGFCLDLLSWSELFEEMDADGDGLISEQEFITAIGMIKHQMLEVQLLEASFVKFRKAAEQSVPEDTGAHSVYASDLVAALGVSSEEAEEMIFIADLKDTQSIDFTEFRQVVVNWSG